MMRLLLILAALLIPLSARAATDQYFNDWQVRHAATPSDFNAMQAVHPGAIASVDNVSGIPQTFVAWPLNTFSCSVPHCYNAPGVQWVDLYTQASSYITWASLPGKPTTFTPSPHEATHLANGSDPISGLSPSQIAACTASQVIVGGTSNACGQVTNAMLAGSISPSKISACSVGQAIVGSGGTNICSYVDFLSLLNIPTITATSPVLLNGGASCSLGSPCAVSAPTVLTGSLTSGKIPRASGATSLVDSLLSISGSMCIVSGGITVTGSSYLQGTEIHGADIYGDVWLHNGAAAGRLAVSGADGHVDWSDISTLQLVKIGGDIGGTSTAPTVIAATGSGGTLPVNATTVQFVAGVTGATLKQAPTSGAPHDMTIEAQSSSTNSYSPAFLNLNAGYNTGGGIGAIQFGYAGSPGAFGAVSSTGANFQNGLTSSNGSISHNASSPSETHVIGRNAGFAMAEDTLWFSGTSTSTANVNFDITTWLGSAGIPDNHTYFATYEIYSAGLPNATTTAAATWTKASGTLTAQQGVPGINSGALTMGASNPTNNTMRFAITPPTSTTTVWTAKVHVVQL